MDHSHVVGAWVASHIQPLTHLSELKAVQNKLSLSDVKQRHEVKQNMHAAH